MRNITVSQNFEFIFDCMGIFNAVKRKNYPVKNGNYCIININLLSHVYYHTNYRDIVLKRKFPHERDSPVTATKIKTSSIFAVSGMKFSSKIA